MTRSTSVLLALGMVLVGVSTTALLWVGYAGEEPSAPKKEETVAAKRYRTRVVVHAGRGSVWIEELFFPDKGVCANVEVSVETKGKDFDFPHVLNAFYGPIRSKFRMEFHDEKDSVSPVEDVSVPASLAKDIFEAADLQRRMAQLRHDIGAKVSDLGLCRDLDGDGKPREKPAEPGTK